MKKFCLAFIAILVLCVMPVYSQAASYPTRPITIQVGFAAGGFADIIMRQVASIASKELGKPIVISNMPGSGGGTMAMSLKRAKPDGYTLGATMSDTFALNPLTGAQYSLEEFTFISGLVDFQEAFVTAPDKPYNTFPEMLAWAKKNNVSINASVMSQTERLVLKAIQKNEGVKFNLVPAQGGSAIVTTVMGGHSDIGYSGGVHYEYAKAGKLKILAATTPERLLAFPDAPTLIEEGFPYVAHQYLMVAAPKGLPDDIRIVLNNAFGKAMRDPSVIELVENKIAMQVKFRDSAAVVESMRDTAEKYKELLAITD